MKRIITQSLLFITYAMFAAAWVSGSMLTPDIQVEFEQSGLASASWGANMITLAKIVGNLIAAWFLVKLGSKKAFAFALLLVVLGGAGAWSMGYDQWLISRLILGFGGALALVYFNPYVIHYFTPDERPVINGINAAAFNTGNLIALVTTAGLLEAFGGWREVVQVYFWVPLALLVLWMIVTEDIKAPEGQADHGSYRLADGIKDPFNWILPLAYCGILFCYISIFTVFPLLDGFAVQTKHLSAVLIASGMLGTVAGIIATKRLTKRLPILKICGAILVVSAATMISTETPAIAYTAAALAGFFMFMPMTALVTIPQELPNMTPGRITVVFGMFWSISYAVETVMMWAASTVADALGDPSFLAWTAVISSGSLFALSFFLPETGKETTA